MAVVIWNVKNDKNINGEVLDHTLGEKSEVEIRAFGSLNWWLEVYTRLNVLFIGSNYRLSKGNLPMD